MVLFERAPRKWIPNLYPRTSFDCATLGQTPAALAAIAFLEGRCISRRSQCEASSRPGAQAAGRSQTWSGHCYHSSRLILPYSISTLGLLSPLSALRRASCWGGACPSAKDHLAAQRNKMRALLQELGVRVHSTHVRAAGRKGTPLPPMRPSSALLTMLPI